MKFCENCGFKTSDDALFCEECGKKFDETDVTVHTPSTEASHVTSIETKKESTSKNSSIFDSYSKVTQKQESPKTSTYKVKDTKKSPWEEPSTWFLIIALIICSPLILIIPMEMLFMLIPELIWWIIFFGLQITVLAVMWKNQSFPIFIKTIVTILYILQYFI